MHWVGYRAVKSLAHVKKKSEIAHNFFMTKATDLKTTFWKLLKNVSHLNICLIQKIYFFIFSTLLWQFFQIFLI